jgi:hypothetical protein
MLTIYLLFLLSPRGKDIIRSSRMRRNEIRRVQGAQRCESARISRGSTLRHGFAASVARVHAAAVSKARTAARAGEEANYGA